MRRIATRSEERRVGKEGRSRCAGSSDVCSSDLTLHAIINDKPPRLAQSPELQEIVEKAIAKDAADRYQIGRASCRERGEISVCREFRRVLFRSHAARDYQR